MTKIAVYPGTFDPITKGHLDIICRSAKHIVDKLIIGIAADTAKQPLFSLEERTQMVQHEIGKLDSDISSKIEVTAFDGLLIHFVQKMGASMVVRGLRAITDFEYEFQMTGMNAKMDKNIETVFLMASEQQQFISSRFVKEIFRLGGDVSPFVSEEIISQLTPKLKK